MCEDLRVCCNLQPIVCELLLMVNVYILRWWRVISAHTSTPICGWPAMNGGLTSVESWLMLLFGGRLQPTHV